MLSGIIFELTGSSVEPTVHPSDHPVRASFSGQESYQGCLKTPLIGQFLWPSDHPMIVNFLQKIFRTSFDPASSPNNTVGLCGA